MNPELEAANPEDLVEKLDADLKAIGSDPSLTTKAEWYEKQQLWHFLRAVAETTELLQYPLTVTHTSRTRPDFKLSLPAATIGIEVSRVSNEAFERLDHLHGQNMTPPVVGISHTLVCGAPMNNDALVAATVPGGEWNTPASECAFWKQQTQGMVARKTTIRRQVGYQDYGRNWLVLWDRLPGDDFRVHASLLRGVLTSYWSEEKVFDVIILESEELKDFAVFSRDDVMMLV